MYMCVCVCICMCVCECECVCVCVCVCVYCSVILLYTDECLITAMIIIIDNFRSLRFLRIS